MLQERGLDEADYRGERFRASARPLRGNHDLLCLTRPDVVAEIHDAYLGAGADIVLTNTFTATSIAQGDYDTAHLAAEINEAGARIARERAGAWSTPDRPRFAAGVLGPTNRTASISPRVEDPGARNTSFDELRGAYEEAARALIAGGVDLLLVETVFDTLNAKAAIFALESAFEGLGRSLPVIVSGTITDASGRTLSGQTVEAFWNSIRHARPLAAGLNCALGPVELRPWLEELARVADVPVSAHPNAGLPNELGGYDLSPDALAREIGDWARRGLVNIAGGCCGTTPDHIRAVAEAVAGVSPRVPPARPRITRLAGLEPLNIAPDSLFVNVGERTNVTGSPPFRAARPRRGLRDRARDSPEPGGQRRPGDRRQHGRGVARLRGVHGALPPPRRHRAGHRAGPGDDRLLALGGDRGGAQVRAGQGDRQLDQPQERARGIRRAGPPRASLRCGGGGHGLRRGGAGGYPRAAHRGLRAGVRAARAGRGLSPRGHRLRSQHLRGRDGHRGAPLVCRRLHRRDPARQGAPPRRPRLRGPVQRLFRIPRQQPGPRGDARRVPVPRDPGGARHGHRQRRPAHPSSTTWSRSSGSGSRTWSSTAVPTRASGSSRSRNAMPGRNVQAATTRRRSGGPGRSRSGSSTPSSRGWRTISKPTRRRRDAPRPAPSTSSRVR